MLRGITALLVILSTDVSFGMACYYAFATAGQVKFPSNFNRLAMPVQLVPAIEYLGLACAILSLAMRRYDLAAVGVDTIALGIVLRWRGAKPENRPWERWTLGLALVTTALIALFKVLYALYPGQF